MKKNRSYVCILGILFCFSAAAAQNGDKGGALKTKCYANQPVPNTGTIASGVDGDTAHVRTTDGKTYSVRMLSIDTPETHYNGKSQGEWGEKAAARLQEILPVGTAVQLEFGQEICDVNGRVLAHIYKGKTNVNEVMVREGWAVNYCIAPNLNHCEEFGALANANLRERRGFLGDPQMEIPYIWRRLVSKRPFTSYVGDIATKEVFLPGHEDRVAVGNRVFFLNKDAIQAPYRLVE